MIIYKKYENKTDKCWYKSSNIVYSECYDKENDFKELKIFFNNGSTYTYHKVDVRDYLLFRESVSQGKALNEYIKKYEYNKTENADIEQIKLQLTNILEEEKQ